MKPVTLKFIVDPDLSPIARQYINKLLAMTPEERTAFVERFNSITPEQIQAWREGRNG